MPYNYYEDALSFCLNTLSATGQPQPSRPDFFQPPLPDSFTQERVALYVYGAGYVANDEVLRMIHYILSIEGNMEKLSDELGTIEGAAALRGLLENLDERFAEE